MTATNQHADANAAERLPWHLVLELVDDERSLARCAVVCKRLRACVDDRAHDAWWLRLARRRLGPELAASVWTALDREDPSQRLGSAGFDRFGPLEPSGASEYGLWSRSVRDTVARSLAVTFVATHRSRCRQVRELANMAAVLGWSSDAAACAAWVAVDPDDRWDRALFLRFRAALELRRGVLDDLAMLVRILNGCCALAVRALLYLDACSPRSDVVWEMLRSAANNANSLRWVRGSRSLDELLRILHSCMPRYGIDGSIGPTAVTENSGNPFVDGAH
ncbi:Hypothetical protein UVM_LOCUS416 [uncultured virus]|nr:Hypothetical protein UVM_LOCUS416 [uncultured virus]